MGEHMRDATEVERLTGMRAEPNPYLPPCADAPVEHEFWRDMAGTPDYPRVEDGWVRCFDCEEQQSYCGHAEPFSAVYLPPLSRPKED